MPGFSINVFLAICQPCDGACYTWTIHPKVGTMKSCSPCSVWTCITPDCLDHLIINWHGSTYPEAVLCNTTLKGVQASVQASLAICYWQQPVFRNWSRSGSVRLCGPDKNPPVSSAINIDSGLCTYTEHVISIRRQELDKRQDNEPLSAKELLVGNANKTTVVKYQVLFSDSTTPAADTPCSVPRIRSAT